MYRGIHLVYLISPGFLLWTTVLFCQKPICVYWDAVFVIQCIYRVDYMYWLLYIILSLYLWDKTFFIISISSDCQYLVEYFWSFIHKENWSGILFCYWEFMWFKYQGNCVLIKYFFLVLILWNNLRSTRVNSVLKVW